VIVGDADVPGQGTDENRSTGAGYNCTVITRGIREYMARDWAAFARLKRDYWAAQYRAHGAAPALRAAWQLVEYARVVIPGYPAPADRAADLDHHRVMRDRLDRAARAIASR
jgi:hypothetical protein